MGDRLVLEVRIGLFYELMQSDLTSFLATDRIN